MLCGTLPFDDDPSNESPNNLLLLYKYIMETTLTFAVELSSDVTDLIRGILNTNPKERATLEEIKGHAWLNSCIFGDYPKYMEIPDAAPCTLTEESISMQEDSVPVLDAPSVGTLSAVEMYVPDQDILVIGEEEIVVEKEKGKQILTEEDSLDVIMVQSDHQDEIEDLPSFGLNRKATVSFSISTPTASNLSTPRPSMPRVTVLPISSNSSSISIKPAPPMRQSLNLIAIGFKEMAHRAQSLDLRRNVPILDSVNHKLSTHFGPMDQRAISMLSPSILLSKVEEALEDMNLQFSFSHQSPFKLVATQSFKRREVKQGKLKTSISSFFTRLRYISLFGLQYNKGYDGSGYKKAGAPLDFYVKFSVVVHRIRNIEGVFIL